MSRGISFHLVLLAVLVFIQTDCGISAAQPTEMPTHSSESAKQLQVRSIQFEGNEIISSASLKALLSTKEARFRWFAKAPLKEEILTADLERIQKYYLSQGFYHMRLLSHEIQPMVGNNARIIIRVDEGPPMIVGEMQFSMNGLPAWRGEIMKAIPLKAGERFTMPAYKDTEKVALKFLGERGHPKAKIEMRARLDKATNLGSVFMEIDVGPICKFGKIRVEGNESVDAGVVMREVTFREGARFNAAEIEATQQKLFSLDLFQYVDISIDNAEDSSTILPVRILVKEGKKQTVRVGLGYGTEDQVRGQLQYEVRNFLGDGRRLQINGKASSIVQLLEGRFIQPYFLDSSGSVILDGGILHEDQESFENRKIYMRPVYEYRWWDGFVTSFGYNFETNRLIDVDLVLAERLSRDQEHQEHYISSIIAGNLWEEVDSTLNPHKGWRLLQNIEWAANALGSEADYLRLTLEGRGYIPTWSYGVLAARLKWGGIEPVRSSADSIPIFKRLFSGGSDSVRGYPYQRLGPLDVDGNPIGGLGLLEGSLEWRFPIRKPFEGVLFFDFGNISSEINSFSWADTRYTAGVGLRYLTIVGPLRVDFGYELNPPEQDFFSPYQVHFSIGQAF